VSIRGSKTAPHSCPFVVQNHTSIRIHSWFKTTPAFVSIRGSKPPLHSYPFVVQSTPIRGSPTAPPRPPPRDPAQDLSRSSQSPAPQSESQQAHAPESLHLCHRTSTVSIRLSVSCLFCGTVLQLKFHTETVRLRQTAPLQKHGRPGNDWQERSEQRNPGDSDNPGL
jgi:hypothetical protein